MLDTPTICFAVVAAVLAGARVIEVEFWVPAFIVRWLESGVSDLYGASDLTDGVHFTQEKI